MRLCDNILALSHVPPPEGLDPVKKRMYDPTFGPTSLERHLRKGDFDKFPALKAAGGREAAILAAVNLGKAGLATMPLSKNNLAGRDVYQTSDLSSELVLRKAAQNLRKISNAKQGNRLDIVRRLRLFCEEGMPFCIAKFDVKNFYPSVDQSALVDLLAKRLATAPSTRLVLSTFLSRCAALGIPGLPPGLAISAALSELYLQDFDRHMRRNLRAHLYARYVDDIVVVLPPSSGTKRIRKTIAGALPSGLTLNAKKSRVVEFSKDKKTTPVLECTFDYLGFNFSVYETSKKPQPNARKVTVDIASSKVKKRKTRMIKSAQQFLADGNFSDLHDRIKIITCNYRFFDHQKDQFRLAGLKHTYGLIDLPSNALGELDLFQKQLLLSKAGKICGPLYAALTNEQRKKLLRLSSMKGFVNDVHFHFAPDRLKHLMDCWKYA